MNYLQKKKLAFMSIVNRVKGFIRTISGVLPLTLTNCVDSESITDYTIYGNSVQNGTPTPTTPIEVECVGEYDEIIGKYKIPIKASGKNLFDIDKAENGSIHDLSGDNLEKDNRARTNYIYVKAGTYCVSTISTSGGVRSSTICHAYSSPLESTYIGAVNATSGTILTGTKAYSIFTILVDCYVRFIFLPMSDSSITDLNTNTLNDFKPQIERGDMPTDYEPYHEPITTNIYLDEPLRKVGDYADYVDLENGKVVRKIKKKQLTKAITLYTIGGVLGFYTDFDFLDANYSRVKGLCNREKTFTETLKDGTTIWLGVNNSIVYWIGILSKLGFTTLEQMNSWLSENETWIYWATKTPTEEHIELPNLPTFKGTSIITADTTVQPSNAEIEYYSNVKE